MPYSQGPRKLNRLPGYDYSSIGAYFLTIRPRADIVMGRVINGTMVHNRLGKLVDTALRAIPDHYVAVKLDLHIVMPDHIHGILIIDDEVEKMGPAHFGLISKVVKSFKEAVTKTVIRELPKSDFGWQRSFHDRILRDEEELNAARKYIIENPMQWRADK